MSTLFDPGSLQLPSRLVITPMTRNRATSKGVVTSMTAEYYAQRAGAGLIISESIQPSVMGRGYILTPGLHSAEQVAAWRTVTEAVEFARSARNAIEAGFDILNPHETMAIFPATADVAQQTVEAGIADAVSLAVLWLVQPPDRLTDSAERKVVDSSNQPFRPRRTDHMTRTVFVTGARGKTGREVVAQLAGHGDTEVRGGSSRSAHEPTTVAFDWRDRSTWPKAVDGADAIYLGRPDVQDAPELITQLVATAPGAHIVLVSEQGAERVGADSWVRQVEAAVTTNSTRWTILRPSWFQQVLTDSRYFLNAIRLDRTISLPTAGTPIAWIDTRDIAAVAVQAIADPATHHGKAYTLTGPEAVTTADIAADISAAISTEVTAVVPPLSETLAGADPWFADVVGEMFGRVHDGTFATVSDTVERVAGSSPRTVKEFIAEHADQWRV